MLSSKQYKINLDLSISGNLRNKINQYQDWSITKTEKINIKNKQLEENAWKRICAIMDRIEDTASYLVTLSVTNKECTRGAFSFYNFMNNASVLIDCIEALGKIYDFDFSSVNNSNQFFNNPGLDNKGSDYRYFQYLRSLCTVHPINTNRHPAYMDPSTRSECSPFVYWTEDNDTDLKAVVYTDSSFTKDIYINMNEIMRYVSFRYELLNELINKVETYYQTVKTDYRSAILKPESEFKTFIEYLDYLKKEYSKRIKDGWDEIFEFYEYALQKSFTDEKNSSALAKYKNAIKYSIKFLQKQIQSIPNEDSLDTTGIKEQPKNTTGETLFFRLDDNAQFSNYEDYQSVHYEMQSLRSLFDYDKYDFVKKEYYKKIEKYISPCVTIDFETMDNQEIGLLTQVAIYFINLNNDSILNDNIPNTNDYRL